VRPAPVTEFRPPRALASAALQTIVGSLPLWAAPLSSELWRVPIAGGAIHLHVNLRSRRGPAALIVHGIGGSSESLYVRRAAAVLLAEGYHVARIDMRGAGASLVDAPSLYHAGLIGDLEAAAAMLGAHPLVDGVALVGFSLGGNVVLKLGGSWAAAPPAYARAAVAISPVIDLGPASRAFERSSAVVYRVYIVHKLVAMARAFARAYPDRARGLRLEGLTSLSTVRAYDEGIVVPMHGFADVEDYYSRSGSSAELLAMTLPTLVAFAEDDPLVPASTVQPWLARAPASVETAWSKQGGHVGWYEGVSREGFHMTWPVRRALAFLRTRT
jgi:predicted alpha/beta-fold hydrolase